MSQFTLSIWGYARAFALIFICLWIGNALSEWLHLNIPGSIIGMLVLFALLCTRIIRPDWVRSGCSLFIRYMAVLFIPIGVGLINHYNQLSSELGAFLASTTVSTIIVMTTVAVVYQRIHKTSSDSKSPPSADSNVEKQS
ncbi:MAG: CidA/LrgA family protein [Plesiomonas sp.]|uniref:CidA/LrgA family protein n=1 Tax=Plesiomonas sp. TaxID=2486279 RepID=UPI003F353B35